MKIPLSAGKTIKVKVKEYRQEKSLALHITWCDFCKTEVNMLTSKNLRQEVGCSIHTVCGGKLPECLLPRDKDDWGTNLWATGVGAKPTLPPVPVPTAPLLGYLLSVPQAMMVPRCNVCNLSIHSYPDFGCAGYPTLNHPCPDCNAISNGAHGYDCKLRARYLIAVAVGVDKFCMCGHLAVLHFATLTAFAVTGTTNASCTSCIDCLNVTDPQSVMPQPAGVFTIP